MNFEFKTWPKIKRYVSNELVRITEKIDGSNSCIIIIDGKVAGTQSRNKIISMAKDNFGFSNWVENNKEELAELGDGYHFGEWAGPKIHGNRHNLGKREFFLFNAGRWSDNNTPSCVNVVGVLFTGPMESMTISEAMYGLSVKGLKEGYKPEGIIVYYSRTGSYRKVTYAFAKGKWDKK